MVSEVTKKMNSGAEHRKDGSKVATVTVSAGEHRLRSGIGAVPTEAGARELRLRRAVVGGVERVGIRFGCRRAYRPARSFSTERDAR